MRCKCFSYIFPFDTVLCPGVLGTVQWKEREASIKSGTQLNSAERNTHPDSTAVRLLCAEQGCITFGSLAARLRENGERMKKCGVNGKIMRKRREIHSLHFLLFSLFPPSLSISYIIFFSQNVKYGTFVANVTKKLNMRYETIIMGRILLLLEQPKISPPFSDFTLFKESARCASCNDLAQLYSYPIIHPFSLIAFF